MSKTYFRVPQMVTGGPFRCYNCDRTLIKKLTGDEYEIELTCPRCKAEIKVRCKEEIPIAKKEEVQSES